VIVDSVNPVYVVWVIENENGKLLRSRVVTVVDRILLLLMLLLFLLLLVV
jgi:hypothetical protein